jgi:arylformamidase
MPRMPQTPASHSFAECPVTDFATLTALYDNNNSPRNAADLKALQACSAAAFASPSLARERVALGAGEWAWADVFRPPEARGPLPALLFVHGGRWQLNTSHETAFWAQACCDSGFAFVGLNFPPLSAVGLPAQIAHVAQAIAMVRLRAVDLNLNAAALALAGHSSGAHLALTALLRHPPAVMPRALLLLGGIYDLAPLRRTAHQDSLDLSAEDAATCSPLQLVLEVGHERELRLPPTLVAVGADETSEFVRQSLALHQALQPHTAAGWLEVPDAAHFDAALTFNKTDAGMSQNPSPSLHTFIAHAWTKD